MAKKYQLIQLDGQDYKLRLTFGAQKRLREQFHQPPLDVAMNAAGDEEKLCALLHEALDWPESGNPITDGEVFCDLLVDNGYAGQDRFNGLVMDIAAASGMITVDNAARYRQGMTRMLRKVYDRAFDQMEHAVDKLEDELGAADTEENPTTTPSV